MFLNEYCSFYLEWHTSKLWKLLRHKPLSLWTKTRHLVKSVSCQLRHNLIIGNKNCNKGNQLVLIFLSYLFQGWQACYDWVTWNFDKTSISSTFFTLFMWTKLVKLFEYCKQPFQKANKSYSFFGSFLIICAAVERSSWLQLVSFPPALLLQRCNKYLTKLVFLAHTLSYGSSFFPVEKHAPRAHNGNGNGNKLGP